MNQQGFGAMLNSDITAGVQEDHERQQSKTADSSMTGSSMHMTCTTKIGGQGKKKKSNASTSQPTKKRKTFPSRLYDMVNDAKDQGYDHIVSWTEDGRGFLLKDIPLLEEQILPQYFGHIKFRSFSRQLCYWTFERTTIGADSSGAYEHPGFVRGKRALLSLITRQKFKGVSMKRNGIYINLKQTVIKEARSQAVSTLQQVELECMQELVTRNLALANEHSSRSATSTDLTIATIPPTMPRRVSEDLPNMAKESKNYQDLGNTHLLGDEQQDAASEQQWSPSNFFVVHSPFTNHESRLTPRRILNTASAADSSTFPLPFEGRYFHDVLEGAKGANTPRSHYETLIPTTPSTQQHHHNLITTPPCDHTTLATREFAATGLMMPAIPGKLELPWASNTRIRNEVVPHTPNVEDVDYDCALVEGHYSPLKATFDDYIANFAAV
jgi:hypothetical protein